MPSIDTFVVADQVPSVGACWSTTFLALTVPPVMSPPCALICSLPSVTEYPAGYSLRIVVQRQWFSAVPSNGSFASIGPEHWIGSFCLTSR